MYSHQQQLRMRLFAEQEKASRERYKAMGVTRIEILSAPDACDACKALPRMYNIDEAPELPHPGCTHPMGCRCIGMADPDSIKNDRISTMALGICRECGKEVSDKARVCPHCGVKKPIKKTSLLAKLLLGMMLIGFAAMFAAGVSESNRRSALTPEQRATEDKKSRDDTARYEAGMKVAQLLHKTAHDPASIEFVSVTTNTDGTITCAEYRGKNKFGAVIKSYTVITPASITSNNTAAWNKNCKKAPFDMTYAANAWLKRL